jgi:hypothetical protein
MDEQAIARARTHAHAHTHVLTCLKGGKPDGLCSADAKGATINFGANSTTSCAIALTRSELETFCKCVKTVMAFLARTCACVLGGRVGG